MRLHHLHKSNPIPYLQSAKLQSSLVERHLSHKARPKEAPLPPPPTLLTFQSTPVYTCGRREIGTLSGEQISYLKCNSKAEFHEALRGGQTTFHGPGQLTAYLILDLKKHGLTPRTYVRMLETVTMQTCAHYGIKSFTTENPGVWTTEDDKIASVGVHLRRGVASHGVGLNISVDLGWFDRIVACGLVGKKATSFWKEGVQGVGLGEVAGVMARKFVENLDGVDEVLNITEE
ncbi:MAG: hypothetical protein MMC33_006469 [Icmadophila ericetorum]|nr:hypothetical protein [Icmadophila ericetorum]